jgi:hypothetical protein
LALLKDPFDPKLLDVIIFDALPHMDINGEGQISLAKEIKERNPLHFGFQVLFSYYNLLFSLSKLVSQYLRPTKFIVLLYQVCLGKLLQNFFWLKN